MDKKELIFKSKKFSLYFLDLAWEGVASVAFSEGSYTKRALMGMALTFVRQKIGQASRSILSSFTEIVPSSLHDTLSAHCVATSKGKERSLILLLYGPRGSGKSFIATEALSIANAHGFSVSREVLNIERDMAVASADQESPLRRDGQTSFTITQIDEIDRMLENQKDVAYLIAFLDRKRRVPGIVIMTTNNINAVNKFDTTILRAGRVDMLIEYKGFTEAQALDFLAHHGKQWDYSLGPLPTKPAELDHYVYTGVYEKVED